LEGSKDVELGLETRIAIFLSLIIGIAITIIFLNRSARSDFLAPSFKPILKQALHFLSRRVKKNAGFSLLYRRRGFGCTQISGHPAIIPGDQTEVEINPDA